MHIGFNLGILGVIAFSFPSPNPENGLSAYSCSFTSVISNKGSSST